MMSRPPPLTRGWFGYSSVSAAAAALGALLLGCGGDAADPDRNVSPAPSNGVEPGAAANGGDEVVSGVDPVADSVDASPLCASAFQACGGTLAGSWVVEGACTDETADGMPALIWGQGFVNMDWTACSDAVPTLTSRWSGTLLFEGGQVTDERLRSDTLEIDLTRGCLSTGLSVDVGEQNLAAVCSSVATESTACASLDGVCHCSARREHQPAASGPYGVVGTRVAVGSIRGQAFFEYCVDGSLLRLQDPDSGHHVLLRRTAATSLDDAEE